jgi:hypothetical protein
MYKWVNFQGETIKTKTVKEFSEKTGMRYSNALSLACANKLTLNGWMSTHPKAKKRRERVLTRLVNLKTGEISFLGNSANRWARQRGLCENEVWKLLNGWKIAYRDWVTEKTYRATHGALAGANV